VQEEQHYSLQPGSAGFRVGRDENVPALALPVLAQHVEALLMERGVSREEKGTNATGVCREVRV